MNAFAHLVLLAFVPLALVLFACIRARNAVLAVIAAGTMFLPVLVLDLPGPLSLGKSEAVSFALLLGVILFDGSRLATLRFSGWDVAFVVALIAGSFASISNSLGSYDAFASLLTLSVQAGIPYLIGKLYLSSVEGLRALLWMFVISGVVYAPFCLYEIRMSPQLHATLYGSLQHSFAQTMRGGGWRPMVFMSHGLELSLWMAVATVSSFALWRAGARLGPLGVPMAVIFMGLAVTLLLCKSTGAIFLGAMAILAMIPGCHRWLPGAMLLGVPIYLGIRVFGGGLVEAAVVNAARLVSDERAASLQFRFDSEARLLDKLWATPWFGSSGWRLGLVYDPETGEGSAVVVDSYWIIATTTRGLFGLFGAVGVLWLPAFRVLGWVGGLPAWRSPERLAACALLTMLILDSMVNAFVSPVYLALAGGLSRLPLARSLSAQAVSGAMPAPRSSMLNLGSASTSQSRDTPSRRAPRPVPLLRPRRNTRG